MDGAQKNQTHRPVAEDRGTGRSKRRKAAAVVILAMMGVTATDGRSFPASDPESAATGQQYHELDALLTDLAAGAEPVDADDSNESADSHRASESPDSEFSLATAAFARPQPNDDAAGSQATSTFAQFTATEVTTAAEVTTAFGDDEPATSHPVIRLTGTIEPLP